MLFTGEYLHTIDDKQRLAVPSEIRSRLRPEIHGEAFYLVPGPNGCLWLWPELTFEQLSAALERSLLPGQDLMEFEELLYSQSRLLELDKTGRIRLPEQTLAEYGLGQNVVILGVKDHLELRDPDQWKSQRQQKLAKQSEIMLRARHAVGRGGAVKAEHSGGAGREQDRP